MIDLVFGLHLYQPPNQTPDIMKRITDESYLPVIKLILKHPCARFTADIAKSAVEKLADCDSGKEFLKKLREAADLQKIFPANTAAYHPILPLLPNKETERQILLNEATYRNLFNYRAQGLFPPEMAYSQKIIPVLERLGYEWTITSDTPFVCRHNHNPDPPFNWIPSQKNIAIFLRSDFWSRKIAFDHISGSIFTANLKQELNRWFGGQRGYLIIWLDWETFGHHRKYFIENFLAPFLDGLNNEVILRSPEELLSFYPKKEIAIPPGSWSTNCQDFYYKNYWPLWKSPYIEFHRLWWELAGIILEIKKNIQSEEQLSVFDKAVYSCQTWQWSMGNKALAIKGMEYFREIIGLNEAALQRENAEKIIEKMENMCK